MRSQLNHGFAEEITVMVGIQVIEQMQDTIRLTFVFNDEASSFPLPMQMVL
ncbi:MULTISPECIES: hypothetical protein [Nostoc]|uniref:Uncharacterized protein n=1 Tax=Nostoc linckia FACHB-391 TaxID=2692906 RepID=A0ABR8EQN2_NOSLI|nr:MULTISPECIES: hypothetical protein [Nostoc]MBD2560157.1 hypothetical protein [Nostoc linckia FACHB-391]